MGATEESRFQHVQTSVLGPFATSESLHVVKARKRAKFWAKEPFVGGKVTSLLGLSCVAPARGARFQSVQSVSSVHSVSWFGEAPNSTKPRISVRPLQSGCDREITIPTRSNERSGSVRNVGLTPRGLLDPRPGPAPEALPHFSSVQFSSVQSVSWFGEAPNSPISRNS